MLDINLMRENPEVVRNALRQRQMDAAPVDQVLDLDLKRRTIILEVETLKAERNAGSKEIGRSKDPEERQAKIEAMRVIGDKISELDNELREVEAELTAVMSWLPNIPDEQLPTASTRARMSFSKPKERSRRSILNLNPTGSWALNWASSISSVASRSLVRAFTCSAGRARVCNGR